MPPFFHIQCITVERHQCATPGQGKKHLPIGLILGVLFSQIHRRLGESERAVEHASAAQQREPNSILAASNLAWLLATLPSAEFRDPLEAVRIMEQVLDAASEPNAKALDTLAASYAAADRFLDAVRVGEEAAAQAEQDGASNLANTIRERILLYRESRPYRDES